MDSVKMEDVIGDLFQKITKYDRKEMKGGMLDWTKKPEVYKVYPDHRKIDLPEFLEIGENINISLFQSLKQRKSIRQFSKEPLSQEHLSYLLWASTGVQREELGYEFRTAPSAGALYPIETYLMVNNVEGLEKGVYHYLIKTHQLDEIKLGNFGKEISLAALNQVMCSEAAVVFVWTAIFFRSKWKYSQRGYRYVYLDAGHIAENLALAATSLNLGSCHIAAIFDDEVNSILDVEGEEESAIYLTCVGHSKL